MATKCRDLGYEYLGISDHSQSAFYAGGLTYDKVMKQFDEIDILNEELKPFRIFKGIESDILSDGALDYPDDVLARFDFIIAAVHSGLEMDIHKATGSYPQSYRKSLYKYFGASNWTYMFTKRSLSFEYGCRNSCLR